MIDFKGFTIFVRFLSFWLGVENFGLVWIMSAEIVYTLHGVWRHIFSGGTFFQKTNKFMPSNRIFAKLVQK